MPEVPNDGDTATATDTPAPCDACPVVQGACIGLSNPGICVRASRADQEAFRKSLARTGRVTSGREPPARGGGG